MKFTKLHLRNIGAYYGNGNSIGLNTTKNKNVILFGGKNGAGKTTLLESLRIVLFGSLAYGFMTENDAYLKQIQTLFNRKAVESGERTFQIILHYTSTENFETINYVLNRTWTLSKNSKIKETFSINRNGRDLTEREVDNYQNRIREEFPPKLFELCLFDGEDISRIVSEGRIPEYLSESAKILFNLDLFYNLEKDLVTYQTQYVQKKDATAEEKRKQQLESEIAKQNNELINLNNQVETLKEESETLKSRLTTLKRDFEIHGGLVEEQRKKLITEINEIENKRKANSEKIKSFTQGLLPIYMVRHLVKEIDQQMEAEKVQESLEIAKSKLDYEKVVSLLKEVYSTVPDQSHRVAYERLLSVFNNEEVQLIHRASFAQRSEIRSLLTELNKIDPVQYLELFDENNKLLHEAQQKRAQLNDHDKASEFKDILNEIENITQTLEQKRLQIEQLELKISELLESIEKLNQELSVVNDNINEIKKTDTSYLMTKKLINVSVRFRAIQLRKKLDQVQIEAVKMLAKILRKKDFITRIYINHETFEISLFNGQNEITKERLSAGEKEILMLCVIWSMFKCSGWRLPLVFDTLLGRLDQDHKRELIQQFIPSCGEQVIILSTDSEITFEQYKLLYPFISKTYTLEFNNNLQQVELLKDQYFNMSMSHMEMV